MKRKRSIISAKRNLTLLVLLILIFAGLVIAVRMMNLSPVLIMAEDRAAYEARRASPENAYHLLIAARELLPPPPPRAMVSNPARPEVKLPYRAKPGSLANLIGVDRPDDDPEFLAYLSQAAPVLEKVHEALEKPYFLWPNPVGMFTPFTGDTFEDLTALLVASALAKINRPEEREAVLGCLKDAIRLTRRIRMQLPEYSQLALSEGDILAKCMALSRQEMPPEDLERLQAALAALGPPYADRREALELLWREIDNALVLPARDRGFAENLIARVVLWQVQRTAKRVIADKDQLYALVEMSPFECNQWIAQRPDFFSRRQRLRLELHFFNTEWMGSLSRIQALVQRIAEAQTRYYGTLLCIALERYQRVHRRYPESLDTLVPNLIPEIPVDPLCGKPFVYRVEDDGYLLYSVGSDGIDHGGSSKPQASLARRTGMWDVSNSPDFVISDSTVNTPAGPPADVMFAPVVRRRR